MLLQMLHGNVAINHLRHFVSFSFTASAYCQARQRLPLEVLKKILKALWEKSLGNVDRDWHGHRTFLIDGTAFSMPDTKCLKKHFGYAPKQKDGCGFPVGHLLGSFHSASGMICEIIPARGGTHDMSQATQIHPALRPGDVLVGDRAFCSFAHTAFILKNKLHAVFRMHQRMKFSPQHALQIVKKLSPCDMIVNWRKASWTPRWLSDAEYQALPNNIIVRWISYRVPRKGFRTKQVQLITTLLDPIAYPSDELAKLYAARWQIETNFNYLKNSMGLDVLRCKTVSGVLKEVYALAIVYNLVRLKMLQAAKDQNVPANRLSFVDALRALRHTPPTPSVVIVININPYRPGRLHPRARKRRLKRYLLLNKPRRSYNFHRLT